MGVLNLDFDFSLPEGVQIKAFSMEILIWLANIQGIPPLLQNIDSTVKLLFSIVGS